MTTKRVLILAPTLLILVLLQSYFWVPTYEQQTKGNPDRLKNYISGSIGDASLLNPTLSADSASSAVQEMVFEGLLDRDEELRFRGRLAASWDIFEEAYFYVNESADIPGLGMANAQTVANRIKTKKAQEISELGLRATLGLINEVSVIPSRTYQVTRQIKDPNTPQGKKNITIHVAAPARIKLRLSQVDQNLFPNLAHILGRDYFDSFNGASYLKSNLLLDRERLAELSAELLPATEHNPIIKFKLRPGVKFHDGHLVDANDVKFTYESIIDPKNLSPRLPDYEPVKAIDVTGPLTIKIIYKRLYSPAIGTWTMGILPEHLLNWKALEAEALRLGKDPKDFSMRQSIFNRRPVGCGPFKFREWKSDQYIILDRFDEYWEGPPNYKEFVFRVIPDLLTQEMEFYAATLDSYAVQPHQVKRLKTDSRFQSFSGLSMGYTYIGYNLRRKPFDDLRVRKALSMAIDANKIIKYVLYNQGERITGPFVKQTDYYNHAIEPIPYNPEAALSLLKEAGWKRNTSGWLEKNGQKLQFTLITNNGNPLREAILAIAQDSWKKIGIDVRTDQLEWAVFIQKRVNMLDFDALILGWALGIEPDLYQIWHSSQTHPYQLNFVGFKDKEADDLIIKIRQEYDHNRQVEYCQRLHEIIARQQPYTFLFVGKWTALLDKRILIKNVDDAGNIRYEKIKPTKTGDFFFHFKKWIKLPEMPIILDEG